MSDTNKIYVDIQSLLDLRQSVLVALMGEEALEYVNKEDYYLRVTDNFPVDLQEMKEMLSTGDVRCLNNTTVTYISTLLTNNLVQMEKLSVFNGDSNRPELLINIYPFKFKDSTVASLKDAIFIKLQHPVLITVVSEPISTWSPSFIKHSGIKQFYCYDTTTWLNNHSSKLEAGDLRECRVYFPSLGHVLPTKHDIRELQKLGFKDIFGYTEFILAPYVKIQFLPVVFYSNLITATMVLDGFNEELVKTQMKAQQTKEDTPDGNLQDTR